MTNLELEQLRYLAEKLRLETFEELEEYEKMNKVGMYADDGARTVYEYRPEYTLYLSLNLLECNVNNLICGD